MKNLLKIGALSLALIATVFMMNTTKAATGDLTLTIEGQSGYCVLGTDADLGDYDFSTSDQTASGDFLNASGVTNTRFCDDRGGSTPWRVDVKSSDVANITTNNTSHTIDSGDVYIKADAGQQFVGSGTCTTTNVGTVNGTRKALDSAQTLFGKTAST
jgi:hypothetical protein